MDEKEILLTQEGYDNLEKQLEYLKTEKRAEISERIKVALGFGDLSENSEYDEAKNAQAENEIKIADLENKLRYAKIIDESEIDTKTVQVGNTVKILDIEFDEELEYTIDVYKRQNLRKVFIPEYNKTFIDADYSQIELRVLAHISNDEHMIDAFNKDEDIHKQVASKVFDTPMDEVTKEQRTRAKAVNFGIVYGISDFGLSEQLKIPRKEAKQYIEQYLSKYQGIKQFMEDIVETAKTEGYVETLFHRRRYIPEIKSNNYMVRQFGSRIAMNTPIQGTAADIMKLAMINVYKELQNKNLKSKIILQVHDELLIEAVEEEKEQVENILKQEMENVIKLKVPLKIDIEEGNNLYDAK